jgi:hypothetical protein
MSKMFDVVLYPALKNVLYGAGHALFISAASSVYVTAVVKEPF